MGAHNSTPQAVRIENPQNGFAVQVTPSVLSRLKGAEDQAQKKTVECMKCKENEQIKLQTSSCEKPQKVPYNWIQAEDVFKRKYHELEEYQFEKTLEKVKVMMGEPLHWLEGTNETITSLRNCLIKCYQDHPQQSLRCADIAKEYQNFIHREQYNTILKSIERNEVDGILSTPNSLPNEAEIS